MLNHNSPVLTHFVLPPRSDYVRSTSNYHKHISSIRIIDLDSTRWKLCEKEVQLRRRLFWQLFFMDTWIVSTHSYKHESHEKLQSQSFCFGRPPIMSHTFIDCSYPLDEDETVDADGHKNMGCMFLTTSWFLTDKLGLKTTTGHYSTRCCCIRSRVLPLALNHPHIL